MLCVCVRSVMDVVVFVCIVMHGAVGARVWEVWVFRHADVVTCSLLMLVVVVRLPRPMEGNGVTSIFRSLQNCQFHHRQLESLEHLMCLIYTYILLSTTVSHFWTLRMPFFLHGLLFCIHFHFASTLCMCVMYLTSIWRILLMTDGLNAVWSNDRAAPTDTNPKNLEIAPPQSVTATRLDQLVYSPNYYIQNFQTQPFARSEDWTLNSIARSKLKFNALTNCAMGAI